MLVWDFMIHAESVNAARVMMIFYDHYSQIGLNVIRKNASLTTSLEVKAIITSCKKAL